jgi:hypothetical protein
MNPAWSCRPPVEHENGVGWAHDPGLKAGEGLGPFGAMAKTTFRNSADFQQEGCVFSLAAYLPFP